MAALFFLAISFFIFNVGSESAATSRPNIVFMLVDDIVCSDDCILLLFPTGPSLALSLSVFVSISGTQRLWVHRQQRIHSVYGIRDSVHRQLGSDRGTPHCQQLCVQSVQSDAFLVDDGALSVHSGTVQFGVQPQLSGGTQSADFDHFRGVQSEWIFHALYRVHTLSVLSVLSKLFLAKAFEHFEFTKVASSHHVPSGSGIWG